MSRETDADAADRPAAGTQASAYVMLTLTSLFWGGNAVAGRLAVGEVSPMTLTCVRWGLITLFLGLMLRTGIREKLPVMRAHWRQIALMGVFGHTVFNGLFYFAAHYTTAMNMLILQGAIPALVILGAFVFYRTGIGALQGAGVAIALSGVVLVATGGDPARLVDLAFNFGDLLMLLGCVAQAGYFLMLRNRIPLEPLLLFFAMGVAAFVSSIPLLAYEAIAGLTFAPTLLGLVLLVYVSIFPSTLAQILLIRGVGILGPGRAGLFINLVPVFGALLAVGLLGETIAYYHALALAAVISGILLAEAQAKRDERPQPR